MNTSISEHFVYVGFWRRVGVTLLDTILFSPVIFANLWLNLDAWAFRSRSPWPPILPLLILHALTLFFVVRYGGTPGNLILDTHIVNQEGYGVDLARATRRDLFAYLGTLAYALLIWQTLRQSPPGLSPTTPSDFVVAYKQYGGGWNQVDLSLNLFMIVDVLIVALNRRKRALHDFLAGSYVITKRSYEALKLQRY